MGLTVKVKHLVQYLESLDQDIEVIPDKDGWLENEIKPKDEIDLIKNRGLFHQWKYNNNKYLIINN